MEFIKGNHLAVRVRDLDETVKFYKDTIGLDLLREVNLEGGGRIVFLKGLEIYRKQDWIHAYDMFQKALTLNQNDGPSHEFIRRCKFFIENPRPADWDGVFELRDK